MISKRIAVLTGDLVHSTNLGPAKIEQAFEALEDCAKTQEDRHGAPLHFTRHRGDGWQVVLAKPEMALRSALAFRAALRALGEEFETYIGGSHALEQKLRFSANLNEETGDAFHFSGLALSWAKGSGGLHFMSYHPKGPLDAAFVLADRISRDWSQPQAAAILPFLESEKSPTATDVSKRLGKSRQAVSKALDAAKYSALLTALISIEVGGTDE